MEEERGNEEVDHTCVYVHTPPSAPEAGLHLGSLIFGPFRSILGQLLRITLICSCELTLFPFILLLSE